MTRRVLAALLTVTVLVLVLLEVPLGLFYAQRELERLTADIERDAAVISTVFEDDLERGDPIDSAPALQYAERTGARVVVTDARGIAQVDTEGAVPRDFSTRPEIALALNGRIASGKRRSETLGTDLVYVAIPVASGGTVHGALRLTLPTSEIDSRVHRYWLGLVAVAGVVLALMTMVGWAIARSVTRPVRDLTATATRYAEGDLTPTTARTLSSRDPEELRILRQTLATMAARLSNMLDEQRSFVADASHQLRTPLTALRLRLENLHAGVQEHDAEALEAAIAETDRLTALVGDLLQLARADQPRKRETVDLLEIAEQRVDTWTAIAEGQRVHLALDGSALGSSAAGPTSVSVSAEVTAVPGAIEQILDNALDNALKVAPQDSEVTIRISPTSDGFALSVIDHGPGLSDDDKSRAARRFWRGQPGPTGPDGTAAAMGTGLGLAIAHSLAKASGGSLHFEDTPGGGLTLTVQLTSNEHGVN